MSIFMRSLALSLIALLGVVAAACGSESAPDDSGATDQSEIDTEQFVANIPGVIAQSVQSFEGDAVTSMNGAVEFDFTLGSLEMAGAADFSVNSPDQMYMTLEFEGGDGQSLIDLSELGTFEVLARDGGVYINMPILGGWVALTPEDLGGDYAGLQDLLANGAIFDYASMVESLTGEGLIEYIGQDEVDGHAAARYRVSGDLQTLIGAFSGALSATGDNAFANEILTSQVSGPVTINLWLGIEDLLPYRMEAVANIAAGEEDVLAMSLTATMGNYNETVTIPDAPAEAKTFAELFGDLGLSTE